jgi:hypothetical protein
MLLKFAEFVNVMFEKDSASPVLVRTRGVKFNNDLVHRALHSYVNTTEVWWNLGSGGTDGGG